MRFIVYILATMMVLYGILGITKRAEAYDGKKLYIAYCIKCHNVNPTRAGSIGPALYDTPLSVFKTKVPRGNYPAGYTPKRSTKIMPRFPHLTNKTELIYNYIRSFKRSH